MAPSNAATASAPAVPRLLDSSGRAWPPARLSAATLVVVDAQREYRDGRLPLAGIDAATAEIARLLTRARAAGTPAIHVVQHAPPGSPIFGRDGPMAEILPPLAPRPGEAIVAKTMPSSFTATTLAESLACLGRRELIVVGFMTHVCVSTTVRAALDHGYRCTVVDAACAARDLPDPAGGLVPAALVHRAELAALADRFAAVVARQFDLAD